MCTSHGVWAARSSGYPYVPWDNATHSILSLRSTFVSARFSRAGPLITETGETKWAFFSWIVLLMLVWVCLHWRHAWIEHWRRLCHSIQCSSHLVLRSPPCHDAAVTKKLFFLAPLRFPSGGEKTVSSLEERGFMV